MRDRNPPRAAAAHDPQPLDHEPLPARAPGAAASRRARGDGVAILDTPSLSPSDRSGIRELARLLTELKPERVVVALPASGATAAASCCRR